MKFVSLALALSCVTAYAHHNIGRSVDLKKEVQLEGKIVSVLLRNPHSFLQIEVAGKNGNIERWSLEFPQGAHSLRKQGIEADTLKIGDHVTVIMNPPRKPGAAPGSLVSIHRAADGFDWNAKMKQKQS